MAVIHRTTLKPSKLELLGAWLPSRPWYSGSGSRSGSAGEPDLVKSGGFRLDDPQGEVGIEFLIVTDTSGTHPATYLVPLTYRGAALEGAEHALIGTSDHGVLGRRWVYDGCQDPVLIAQLLALIEGRIEAQDQNTSGAPDREITRSYSGTDLVAADFAAADDREGTALTATNGAVLRVSRELRPAPDGTHALESGATGHVVGYWRTLEGGRAHGTFATAHRSSAHRPFRLGAWPAGPSRMT
jgi:Maltokinase N-terminal cap domain